MVFARSAQTHRCLNMQFEQHRVKKIYRAVTNGVPLWNERSARHSLTTNIGHKHRTVVNHKKGKQSRTDFSVLNRSQEHALLEAQPFSGRTHQVRVHACALGFPLLGDQLYGDSTTNLIGRPALHAYTLVLQIPKSQDWTTDLEDADSWYPSTFSASCPEDFSFALNALSLA